MRGFKEFFRMIVTAIICFGTKRFGGNKKEFVRVCTENGNTFFLTGMNGNWNPSVNAGKDFISKNRNLGRKSRNNLEIKERGLSYPYSRQPLPLKKVMFWKQGPGDRNSDLHKNRSPSRAAIPKEIRYEWMYLVPE